MKYQPVIGLEVHIELATKSKMFCACSTDYFGREPNTHTCPICLGLPGAMPNPNLKAIEYAQLFGIALNCQSQLNTKFDRKNYFYPDLVKGFQISQYDLPFSQNGYLVTKVGRKDKKIRIRRAHLEEDTGKLTHATVDGKRVTLIDFNRSGVPLLEIVTEPDMSSAQEAKSYAQKLQQIARYLKISDADMEKGSMRIEPNVSLRRVSGVRGRASSLPGYKVELKNINSFRFAEKAIVHEIKRQTEILDRGEIPAQETRGYNEVKGITVSQRSKEEAHDYRYFPEPDIPPFAFDKSYIGRLKDKIPELPDEKFTRFKKQFGLSDYDTEILTRDRQLADFFEESTKAGRVEKMSPKQIANYVINKKPDIQEILPATLVKTIAGLTTPIQTDEAKLEAAVKEIVNENTNAVKDYKDGKVSALMFLVGQVMRQLEGKADPNLVKLKLAEKLK